MVGLAERNGAIDLVTLKDELTRSGELDEVGTGQHAIAALVDGDPARSMNVEHYARIIKEKATLRNLIFSANKILATAYEGAEEADVILDQAEHAIFAIADDKVRDGLVSLRELARQPPPRHDRSCRSHKELVTGVTTGYLAFTALPPPRTGRPASMPSTSSSSPRGRRWEKPASAHRYRAASSRCENQHDRRSSSSLRHVEGAVVHAPADGRGAHRRASPARRLPRREGATAEASRQPSAR